MNIRCLCAVALAVLFVSACGKQQPAAAPVAAPASRTDRPTATPTPSASAAPALAEKTPEAARTARIIAEDGSETIEESTGDSGAHNPLLAAVMSSAAAAIPAAKTAWTEGVNYTRLVPAQPTTVGPEQVEVIEIFWYGCTHCYALDPLIESWKKHKAPYVKFFRVPVMWDDEIRRAHARLFYTMENLGRLEELHPLAFKEIHVNNDMLAASDPAVSEKMQMDFLKKNGVSDDQFKKTYRSFSVETSLQRAEQLTVRYRVTGVPMFVINGKYVADVAMAGSPEKLMSLIDDLAAQEHKH